MGYYSTFSGEFYPNELTEEQEKAIVALFKAKWGEYDETSASGCFRGAEYDGNIFYSADDKAILPVEYCMKAYDIEHEVSYILAEIKKLGLGIKFNGDLYVDGEESDDHWKIKVKDNMMFVCPGRVVYDEP